MKSKIKFFRMANSLLALLLVVFSAACQAFKATTPTLPVEPTAATPTFLPTSTPTRVPTSTPTPPFPEHMVPAQIYTLIGVTGEMVSNCATEMNGLPGGIILGMDAETCKPIQNGRQEMEVPVHVPAGYEHSVITVKISWPDDNGRGLRSTKPDQTAQITQGLNVIWAKRVAAKDAASGQYYGARHNPVLVTYVTEQAGYYPIRIRVPAGMLWDINSIDVYASPYPKNILGVAYSPFRDCQMPGTKVKMNDSQIEADLQQLLQNATAIRTYFATGVSQKIPAMAHQLGIPIYAGVWIDATPGEEDSMKKDELEMDGIDYVVRTPVEAVIVGNEYYLRHKNPEAIAYLLKRIRQFKINHPDIPIATAEIDGNGYIFNWDGDIPSINPDYKPILDEINILMVHIYPFWTNQSVQQAADMTVQRYQAIQRLLKEQYAGAKRVIIGEAGWPSMGAPDGGNYGNANAATASKGITIYHPEAQRSYMLALLKLAQKQGVDLFYFDAYDELWKLEGFGGVGQSWGYNYADRSAKYEYSGLLLPPDLIPDPKKMDVVADYTPSAYYADQWVLPVYTEWPRETQMTGQQVQNYKSFIPAYMGDTEGIDIDMCDRNSHSGETATRIQYVPGGEKGWAGVFLLNPEGNWGLEKDGVNLTEAKTLSFWARGEKGTEVVEFLAGGICADFDGKNMPLCPDTLQPKVSTGYLQLNKEWRQYTFTLSGKDLTRVVGGFGLALSQIYNPDKSGTVIYIDDVGFLKSPPAAGEIVYPLPVGDVFPVYRDGNSLDNHYLPSKMGDGAKDGYLTLNLEYKQNVHDGKSAMKISYQKGPDGWAGIYWLEPDGNWGQRPGGYNLSGVKKLSFWARGEKGGEIIEVLIGGVGCQQYLRMPFPDSVCQKITTTFTLTAGWKEYTIALEKYKKDWSHLVGGFGITMNRSETVYLDDIVYDKR